LNLNYESLFSLNKEFYVWENFRGIKKNWKPFYINTLNVK